jgi:methyl-accepting chemotaxis protein
MTEQRPYKRRNYFINKKFQIDFAVRFLALIVIAAIAAMALFLFQSRSTLTAGYSGSEVRLLRTTDFFFPSLLMTSIGVIIVTGIIGIIVLIFISHRIAGPLFRFEKVLGELVKGDLTHRFTLRENDQFTGLADRINELSTALDTRVGEIKTRSAELAALIEDLRALGASQPALGKELERPLLEISRRLSEQQNASNHFKTSRDA